MFISDLELCKKILDAETYEVIRFFIEQHNNTQSSSFRNQYLKIDTWLKKIRPIAMLFYLSDDKKINLYLSQEKKLTKDQNKFLEDILQYYKNLASVWLAIEFRHPLPWEKNKDWYGNKAYREGLEEHVKEIQSFFELIQYAEPLLMQEIERKSSRFSDISNIITLFYKIYSTQAFNYFKECLQPYIEVSNNKIIEALEISGEILKDTSILQRLKPHQRQKIKIYKDLDKTNNPYLTLTYLTCYKAAKAGDAKMQKLLDKWINNRKDNLLYCCKLRKRKRCSNNFNRYYCYCWINLEFRLTKKLE